MNADNKTESIVTPKSVAMIAGSLVHERHTQIYEGFDHRYRFTMVGAKCDDLGQSEVRFDRLRLTSTRDVIRKIPRIRNRVPWISQQYLWGFKNALSDVDLLFPHGTIMPFAYQSIQLKHTTGIKVVVLDLENVPYAAQSLSKQRQQQRQAVLEGSDAIIATTNQVKQCMLMEGVPEAKIHVIPFGVRTDVFRPSSKDSDTLEALSFTSNDIVITYVGDSSWRKGAPTFLLAAKCFTMDKELEGCSVKFLLVGISDTEGMQQQLQYMGIQDKVVLLGRASYKQMVNIYGCSDIIVVPSNPIPTSYEQGSCALLEGSSSGKAMIVSNTGAMPELLGPAGLYYPPADYYGLCQRIKELVLDDEKRNSYGDLARTRACEFYDSRITREKTAMVFDRVLS